MTDEQAKELTYGELMMLCEGHGTSKIYERHIEALAASQRAVWEEVMRECKRQVAVADSSIEGCDGDEFERYNTVITVFTNFGNWCKKQAEAGR